MKKKFLLSCLLIIMAWLPSFAQIQEPVKFKTELKTISDTEAQIVFTGNIDAGWHVYSTDLPSGGPISATFNGKNTRCRADGKAHSTGKRN